MFGDVCVLHFFRFMHAFSKHVRRFVGEIPIADCVDGSRASQLVDLYNKLHHVRVDLRYFGSSLSFRLGRHTK